MSHEPIIPGFLAEDAIYSSLGAWIDSNSLRPSLAEKHRAQRPLLPPLRMGANPALGIQARAIPAFELRPLSKGNRTSLRIWFDAKSEYLPHTLASALSRLSFDREPLLISCSGNCRGISHRLILGSSTAGPARNALNGIWPSMEIKEESKVAFKAAFIDRLKGKMEYRTLQSPEPFWALANIPEGGTQTLYPTIATVPDTDFAVFQLLIATLPSPWFSTLRALSRAEALAATRRMDTEHRMLNPTDQWEALANQVIYVISPRLAYFRSSKESKPRHLTSSLELSLAGIHIAGQRMKISDDTELKRQGFRSSWLKQTLTTGQSAPSGILATSESLTHLFPLPSTETIQQAPETLDLKPRWKELPQTASGPSILLEKRYDQEREIRWADKSRPQHMMVSGVSGKGKSTFLAGLAASLARSGERQEGLGIIDPHDTSIDLFLQCLDESRLDDCILHDPTDEDYVFCLPLLDCTDQDQIDLATSNIAYQISSIFAKTDLGFNIVHGIKNIVRTVLLSPDLSILDMRRLLDRTLSGQELREKVCSQINDEILNDYWMLDFESLDRGSIGRIRSRFEHLFESKLIRPLLANKIRKISYQDIIEQGKIFLARTSPSRTGGGLASILGTLHATGFHTAGFSRPAGSPKEERSIFTLIADEFGNYSNPRNVAHALRTLRKFDISLILATQNVQSLPAEVVQATSNIGTHIAFQQGWDDAHHYYKAFGGEITQQELLNLPVGQGFAKIGDHLARIGTELPPIRRSIKILEEIRQNTRERYCVPRTELIEQVADNNKEARLDKLDLI